MNTTITTMDEIEDGSIASPGAELCKIREQLGFSREYVANKLHLRAKLIELLETDDYLQMPEPVFIMGYIRAYSKLLGVAPEPFIASYNCQHALEKRPEKALWQSKRESNKSELIVRLVTATVAISAIIVIGFWWQNNKDAQPYHSQKNTVNTVSVAAQEEKEPKLSQVSKLQSMFSSNTPSNDKQPLEASGG